MLYSTIGNAIGSVMVVAFLFIGLSLVSQKNASPDFAHEMSLFLLFSFPVLMFWPLKKMAERVAVEYFGIIFNDNDNTLLLPADIDNMSFGEKLRLRFLSSLGEQDRIEIGKITNITREKGINFYIHGDFGSRKIAFTNKQKRDECIPALQARTRVRGGRDYGY